ncbi:hypothetical protein F0M18_13950 [Pseudohalioglobus sediminis]|uniref:Uncharacterized protein n=1 Tax=Pseudohalioglobus sediminis TaxID=2606449 RepID=A0A5B0WQU6_9GAMM|nr:hypothetical protein [Pseudohalioglobus sediminis]KAA1189460.1 hypothetical protein F0M18_13950 [Pseudohalioglobus sediminis]
MIRRVEEAVHSIAKRIFLLCLIQAYAVGCSFENSEVAKLRAACEKDAGVTIHSSVEVEGFYSSSGLQGIIKSGYRFMEYCSDRPPYKSALTEGGCFRISKVERASGRCDPVRNARLSSFVVEPYPEFLENNCIAIEMIEAPTAEYGVINEREKTLASDGVGIHVRSETRVMRMADRQLLGSYIGYYYNRNPGHTGPIGCDFLYDDIPSYTSARLLEDTIPPKP